MSDLNHIPRLLANAADQATTPHVRSTAWALAGNLKDYLTDRHPIRRRRLLIDIDRLAAALRAEHKGHDKHG
jgi:hypothetical protein